jgi:hypothetical protein
LEKWLAKMGVKTKIWVLVLLEFFFFFIINLITSDVFLHTVGYVFSLVVSVASQLLGVKINAIQVFCTELFIDCHPRPAQSFM